MFVFDFIDFLYLPSIVNIPQPPHIIRVNATDPAPSITAFGEVNIPGPMQIIKNNDVQCIYNKQKKTG